MDVRILIDDWSKILYLPPIICLVEIATILTGFYFQSGDKNYKYFAFYLAFDLVALVSGFFIIMNMSIDIDVKKTFYGITNVLIALVELLVYYKFFGQILLGAKIKTTLRLFSLVYVILVIMFIITKFNFLSLGYTYAANLLGAFEFCLLLPPCILYYIQLLKTESNLRLTERPSFWIITGIFFLSIVSIPYYLMNSYLLHINYEYRRLMFALLYDLPLLLNIFFINKAFRCNRTLTR